MNPKRTLTVAAIAALSILGTATRGFAQITRMPQPDTCRTEVSIYQGGWGFGTAGPAGLGGRATFNQFEWLATEVSFDRRGQDEYGGSEGLVIANVRASRAIPTVKGAVIQIGSCCDREWSR
jgi:hypothetical protein